VASAADTFGGLRFKNKDEDEVGLGVVRGCRTQDAGRRTGPKQLFGLHKDKDAHEALRIRYENDTRTRLRPRPRLNVANTWRP